MGAQGTGAVHPRAFHAFQVSNEYWTHFSDMRKIAVRWNGSVWKRTTERLWCNDFILCFQLMLFYSLLQDSIHFWGCGLFHLSSNEPFKSLFSSFCWKTQKQYKVRKISFQPVDQKIIIIIKTRYICLHIALVPSNAEKRRVPWAVGSPFNPHPPTFSHLLSTQTDPCCLFPPKPDLRACNQNARWCMPVCSPKLSSLRPPGYSPSLAHNIPLSPVNADVSFLGQQGLSKTVCKPWNGVLSCGSLQTQHFFHLGAFL